MFWNGRRKRRRRKKNQWRTIMSFGKDFSGGIG
jgi:hypothetical protein